MEFLEFTLRGRTLFPPRETSLYGGESGVTTLRFTGADASKSYKLDLRNEWNGRKNVLDLRNDGGTLTVALTGAASVPAGGYQLQLRTVGDTVWHSDAVRLTVREPIDAVESFDPNVPSEMRQLEQRMTEAAQTAASAAQRAEDAASAASQAAHTDVSGKMDKANPSGTGGLSMNRKPDTAVGLCSTTLGGPSGSNYDYRNTAAGQASVAAGIKTVASGNQAVALGNGCTASGKQALALGIGCEASGENAVAEGRGTIASAAHQHVFGKYNAADADKTLIVGNGTSEAHRKNVMTLDREGNAVFAGTVTAGGRQLGGYVVFRIVGWDTYTLFAPAGTTWAQIVAGECNPFVTLSDGDAQYRHDRLLTVIGGYVYGCGNADMLGGVRFSGNVPLKVGPDLVEASSCPEDGGTYKLEAE